MPLPKPHAGEGKNDFIGRCMSAIKGEFPNNDQRLAVCNDLWAKKESKENKPMIERRAFSIEYRVEGDEKPKLRGHAAVFNQLSEVIGAFGRRFREQIAPGAFTKTLLEADVRALFNHDPNFVLGRNKSGTLSLREDKQGLAIENDPPDTVWARDLTTSIRRGDVDQMSFAFETVKDSWEGEDTPVPTRTLHEVRLYDVSVVTYPAYTQASVDVRSLALLGLDSKLLERSEPNNDHSEEPAQATPSEPEEIHSEAEPETHLEEVKIRPLSLLFQEHRLAMEAIPQIRRKE